MQECVGYSGTYSGPLGDEYWLDTCSVQMLQDYLDYGGYFIDLLPGGLADAIGYAYDFLSNIATLELEAIGATESGLVIQPAGGDFVYASQDDYIARNGPPE